MERPERLSYIFMIFTRRSGSFYFGELLHSTGYFNAPEEELTTYEVQRGCKQHNLSGFAEYFFHIANARGKNSYFLVKSDITEMSELVSYGLFTKIVNQSHFFIMERTDKLAQVISYSIAAQTQQWRSTDPTRQALEPIYNKEFIGRQIILLQNEERRIAAFVATHGIDAMTINYEKMIRDPVGCTRAACAHLGFVHLKCDLSKIRLHRQSNAVNDQWRDRYQMECK